MNKHDSQRETNIVESFKRLAYECDEAERNFVQRQINYRVAQIIRLTREVNYMTHCQHTAIASELKPYQPNVFRLRCTRCRAWLEL